MLWVTDSLIHEHTQCKAKLSLTMLDSHAYSIGTCLHVSQCGEINPPAAGLVACRTLYHVSQVKNVGTKTLTCCVRSKQLAFSPLVDTRSSFKQLSSLEQCE